MRKPFSFQAVQEALQGLHRGGDVSEFHGSLCGALCVQSADEVDLLQLLDAGTPARSRAPELLKALRDEALEALQDEDLRFMPLLPEDDAALAQRVEALALWCHGFLYGLSLRAGFNPAGLSDDAREILEDFSQLTRAGLDADEDGEIEETAYAELVEYLRVGAQLVFMELRPTPTPDPQGSHRLH